MNAAEQVRNPKVAAQVTAIISLFKQQFPGVKANLQPWANDPGTQEWTDPDSIDIGFNLPAGHTLVQVRFHEEHLIGIEAACFGLLGTPRWRFSTIGDWQFEGQTLPPAGFQAKLKQVCQEILHLFHHSSPTDLA